MALVCKFLQVPGVYFGRKVASLTFALNDFSKTRIFEIISKECSLGDPLPKLLKPFRSIEQNGRQS